MAITYRKTPEGKWVACGPASVLRAGATVTVLKRDGTTKQELITSIGKTFDLKGVPHVYGYLTPSHTNAPKPAPPAGNQEMCYECNERPGVKWCRDSSGIEGLCCARCASYSAYERSFG